MDKVIIIAEAGVNHNGDLKKAKKLIDVAVEAGADFVKFQTFNADKLATQVATLAEYQSENVSDSKLSQHNLLKSLELSERDHDVLISYCKLKGINFFSTAFDVDGLEYLHSLGFQQYKIPSGELTNYPYLKKVGTFGKPIIMSTGMANSLEISQAIEVLTDCGIGRKDLTILHCNTEYPTPYSDVNLRAMLTMSRDFGVQVGYSDHTLGIEIPIAAVALGARVIEKHFTLSRDLPGPDHKASLEPDELIRMVAAIRNTELAISGTGLKKPSQSEQKNICIARKSIHLRDNLEAGHVICDDDLIPLRPGDGISPMQWPKIVGRKLLSSLPKHHKLQLHELE